VIEVPGFDGNGPDAKNIAIIKGMLWAQLFLMEKPRLRAVNSC
jgi:hypothetical protein